MKTSKLPLIDISNSNTNIKPQTRGPTASQLLHLFALTLTNSFTLLILTILLVRNIYGLALNTTTIEFWEIERHEAVLRRQWARRRTAGERVDGDCGQTRDDDVVVMKQEFPYDVGIWRNLKAGMGGGWNVSFSIFLFCFSGGDRWSVGGFIFWGGVLSFWGFVLYNLVYHWF